MAIATVLTQISYPLTNGHARDVVTVAVVVLFAAACLVHAAAVRGFAWAAAFFAITGGIGLAAEIAGVTTSFPFGSYHYDLWRLGPSIADVPAIVPLAWTAGIYSVWTVAAFLLPSKPIRILATAIGAVGWDLYLDPQMVADGQWTWTSPRPGLPGLEHIPYTNYLGWFAVALLMAVLIEVVSLFGVHRLQKDSRGLAAVPFALFTWTWLGSALAHTVFLEAPELRYSAFYGFVVMAVLGIPLSLRMWRELQPIELPSLAAVRGAAWPPRSARDRRL
nr:carotenoid biosynthesis protein [Antrihabitans stalactiti]